VAHLTGADLTRENLKGARPRPGGWEDKTEREKVDFWFNLAGGTIKAGLWLLFFIGILSAMK